MSNEDINRCCMGFNACSSHNYILGCVGFIDAYLVHICAPSNEEVSNVNAYLSVRYKKYGINIQCVCDSMCRFLYVSVSLPGSQTDINSFRSTFIPQYLEDMLPNDYFFIGEMAYPCSNKILTPYPGTNLELKKVIFNYYLSHLRVKIENYFGFMTNKCQIFDRPIKTTVSHTSHLLMCISRLHNYVINEGEIVTHTNSEVKGETCYTTETNIHDECEMQKVHFSKSNHLCNHIFDNHLDIPDNHHIISL